MSQHVVCSPVHKYAGDVCSSYVHRVYARILIGINWLCSNVNNQQYLIFAESNYIPLLCISEHATRLIVDFIVVRYLFNCSAWHTGGFIRLVFIYWLSHIATFLFYLYLPNYLPLLNGTHEWLTAKKNKIITKTKNRMRPLTQPIMIFVLSWCVINHRIRLWLLLLLLLLLNARVRVKLKRFNTKKQNKTRGEKKNGGVDVSALCVLCNRNPIRAIKGYTWDAAAAAAVT